MTVALHRLGAACASHPWRTLLTGLAVLAVMTGLAAAFGGSTREDYTLPGTRAQAGIDLLRTNYPEISGAQDRVVVHALDPGARPLTPAVLSDLGRRLQAMPHVASVSMARLSRDHRTALLDVQYRVPVTHPDLMGNVKPLQEAAAPARAAGLQVEFGGDVPNSAGSAVRGSGELIGVAAALVLLFVTFSSLVAAGVPILSALLGLGIGSAGVTLLAAVIRVGPSVPTAASMIGLGVGIDYALLLITRQSEFLRAGRPVAESAALANATAGRSVVFAGVTVLVSLLGLRLSGVPSFEPFGFAAAVTVLSAMVTAVTVVPAMLGLVGRHVLPPRVRAGRSKHKRHSLPWAARWSRQVGQRPLPWLLIGAAVLLALAAPVTDLRMWPTDTSAQPPTSTVRRAYDLVSGNYGPGANGPCLVAIDLRRVPASQLPALVATLRATAGIAQVFGPQVAPSGRAAVIVLEPTTGPSDPATTALVNRLRDLVLPPGAELAGTTPLYVDVNVVLGRRLWLVIGFVVGTSLLLLVVMFRSLIVPLKAAVMNVLSISAAYGVLVAVFQWGWGNGLLGLDQAVPVSSWIPTLMFAAGFGLSMDYEVFLLSRVREEWLAGAGARGSVIDGLAATGGLITAAAAIMVAVFLGFSTEPDLILKMLGTGMAVAVAVDATVVRLVLVPSTMALLGRMNWWLPRWLDRVLPHLEAGVPGGPTEPAGKQARPSLG